MSRRNLINGSIRCNQDKKVTGGLRYISRLVTKSALNFSHHLNASSLKTIFCNSRVGKSDVSNMRRKVPKIKTDSSDICADEFLFDDRNYKENMDSRNTLNTKIKKNVIFTIDSFFLHSNRKMKAQSTHHKYKKSDITFQDSFEMPAGDKIDFKNSFATEKKFFDEKLSKRKDQIKYKLSSSQTSSQIAFVLPNSNDLCEDIFHNYNQSNSIFKRRSSSARASASNLGRDSSSQTQSEMTATETESDIRDKGKRDKSQKKKIKAAKKKLKEENKKRKKNEKKVKRKSKLNSVSAASETSDGSVLTNDLTSNISSLASSTVPDSSSNGKRTRIKFFKKDKKDPKKRSKIEKKMAKKNRNSKHSNFSISTRGSSAKNRRRRRASEPYTEISTEEKERLIREYFITSLRDPEVLNALKMGLMMSASPLLTDIKTYPMAVSISDVELDVDVQVCPDPDNIPNKNYPNQAIAPLDVYSGPVSMSVCGILQNGMNQTVDKSPNEELKLVLECHHDFNEQYDAKVFEKFLEKCLIAAYYRVVKDLRSKDPEEQKNFIQNMQDGFNYQAANALRQQTSHNTCSFSEDSVYINRGSYNNSQVNATNSNKFRIQGPAECVRYLKQALRGEPSNK